MLEWAQEVALEEATEEGMAELTKPLAQHQVEEDALVGLQESLKSD